MSRSSHFFEGVIFGVAAGFVAGILLAPASGKESREKIKEFKDSNEDLIQDTKVKTESMINKTIDAIEQGFDKLSQIVDESKKTKKAA